MGRPSLLGVVGLGNKTMMARDSRDEATLPLLGVKEQASGKQATHQKSLQAMTLLVSPPTLDGSWGYLRHTGRVDDFLLGV